MSLYDLLLERHRVLLDQLRGGDPDEAAQRVEEFVLGLSRPYADLPGTSEHQVICARHLLKAVGSAAELLGASRLTTRRQQTGTPPPPGPVHPRSPAAPSERPVDAPPSRPASSRPSDRPREIVAFDRRWLVVVAAATVVETVIVLVTASVVVAATALLLLPVAAIAAILIARNRRRAREASHADVRDAPAAGLPMADVAVRARPAAPEPPQQEPDTGLLTVDADTVIGRLSAAMLAGDQLLSMLEPEDAVDGGELPGVHQLDPSGVLTLLLLISAARFDEDLSRPAMWLDRVELLFAEAGLEAIPYNGANQRLFELRPGHVSGPRMRVPALATKTGGRLIRRGVLLMPADRSG